MSKHGSPKRYPRVARVNEVVRETLGDELERLNDPRLGMVTITGVEVTGDLRLATVYYSAMGRTGAGGKHRAVIGELDPEQREDLESALKSAAPHLRAELGRQVRLKYTPELVFKADPSIATGNRIDAIIRELHKDDPMYDPLLADDVLRAEYHGSSGAAGDRAGDGAGDGEDAG